MTVFYHYYFLGDEGWGSDFDSEDDEDHEVWLSSLIELFFFVRSQV